MLLRRHIPAPIVCGVVLLALACGANAAAPVSGFAAVAAAQELVLPNKPDSLKFAVIGDNGTGDPPEYEVADQMLRQYKRFPFSLVLMMGDNIYGADRPQDFVKKFEKPYKGLLDAGVKFYACLGNHDQREQVNYKLFNMDGQQYYTFKAPQQNVRFFVLETTYPKPEEIAWFENELQKSNEDWKIVWFHEPIYSSANTHGSDLKLRQVLEPLLIKYNVTLVLGGHDHVYERIKPQNGIQYFVAGSAGQLRKGDIKRGSPLTAKGFDTDNVFMLMEINGDELTFQAISRAALTVDSGVIKCRKPGA